MVELERGVSDPGAALRLSPRPLPAGVAHAPHVAAKGARVSCSICPENVPDKSWMI